MREMNAIGRPSIEDLDVVVQAGVTRRALDARLRPEGVFFSVDPGADATIGGMIATGASGTTTVRYGAMRENVLSITFVDARRRGRPHPFAGAQVLGGLRPDAADDRLRGHARASSARRRCACTPRRRRSPRPQCTFPSVEAAVQCVVMVSQHAIPVARIELADELPDRGDQPPQPDRFTVAPTLFLEFHGGSTAEVETQARETAELAARVRRL